MINDRVTVGDGYVWAETKKPEDGRFVMVMAYAPVLLEGGGHQVTPDGGTVIARQGGVVAGSTGTIKGDPFNVHRSYLHTSQDQSAGSYGGRDFVQLVPVFLDKYQKMGWFPVDNIRIYAGSKQ